MPRGWIVPVVAVVGVTCLGGLAWWARRTPDAPTTMPTQSQVIAARARSALREAAAASQSGGGRADDVPVRDRALATAMVEQLAAAANDLEDCAAGRAGGSLAGCGRPPRTAAAISVSVTPPDEYVLVGRAGGTRFVWHRTGQGVQRTCVPVGERGAGPTARGECASREEIHLLGAMFLGPANPARHWPLADQAIR